MEYDEILKQVEDLRNAVQVNLEASINQAKINRDMWESINALMESYSDLPKDQLQLMKKMFEGMTNMANAIEKLSEEIEILKSK
ncbi:hypothetical protein [Dyadobacter sp. MSC1_007]|jgi:hypothetical protein|uniref:hypothetical protein n=1 Tax=Dyadobacter sp. MSC1_007 TaxID=2909264 RepID=UPI00202E2583|nr:hypothetical protein [Dyadobacter sp. MSC1_007]